MQELTVKQRQYLKGVAHKLEPVVMIGNNGLTNAVIHEIQLNLTAHELIKIKVLEDDRELRHDLIAQITEKSQAQFVQHIGKILIFYRQATKPKLTLPSE